MAIHQDGLITPEELTVLADKITGLRSAATMAGPYEAGYRHALHDAAGEVVTLYRRVSALAYAAEVDAAPPADDDAAGLDELAEVAKSLLGLAVRLDAADQADIDKRLDALGGDDRG